MMMESSTTSNRTSIFSVGPPSCPLSAAICIRDPQARHGIIIALLAAGAALILSSFDEVATCLRAFIDDEQGMLLALHLIFTQNPAIFAYTPTASSGSARSLFASSPSSHSTSHSSSSPPPSFASLPLLPHPSLSASTSSLPSPDATSSCSSFSSSSAAIIPILWAVRECPFPSIVAVLIEKCKLDGTMLDSYADSFTGETALMMAPSFEVTQILVQHGASANVCDKQGWTAIHHHSSLPAHVPILEFLFTHRPEQALQSFPFISSAPQLMMNTTGQQASSSSSSLSLLLLLLCLLLLPLSPSHQCGSLFV